MRVLLIAGVSLLVLTTAGCRFEDERGRGDAPVLNGVGDNTPAEIINFPDSFGNVAEKCDGHGWRIFSTTHGSEAANITVVADPACLTTPPVTTPAPK